MTKKNDIFWNALGSLCYALASMILAFSVLRLAGPRDGGIFGFGYSTLGQQLFIVAYFGIRPFHITDMRGEYSFGEYRLVRGWTSGLALLFGMLYLLWMSVSGSYERERSCILFLLLFIKVMDAYGDVYESEFQRQGKLYKSGQALFYRTVLLVLSLLSVLALTKSLLLACLAGCIVQLLGVYTFDIRPLRDFQMDERPLGSHGVEGLKLEKRDPYCRKLLRNTGLLFISVFLDFYVFSASKYAVDQMMGAEATGIFNILFMPTSFIYLIANFMIRPMLTRLSEEFSEERKQDFAKTCRFMNLFVLLMGAVICLMALIFGKWGLFIFELLLGPRYKGVMQREFLSFFLLILGGGLYALCNVQYYILVTMRKQKEIFWSYLLAAVLALGTAGAMVRSGGMQAGAWNYVLLMGILFLIFSFWVLRSLYFWNHGKRA